VLVKINTQRLCGSRFLTGPRLANETMAEAENDQTTCIRFALRFQFQSMLEHASFYYLTMDYQYKWSVARN
jgi:hypothetical protein